MFEAMPGTKIYTSSESKHPATNANAMDDEKQCSNAAEKEEPNAATARHRTHNFQQLSGCSLYSKSLGD